MPRRSEAGSSSHSSTAEVEFFLTTVRLDGPARGTAGQEGGAGQWGWGRAVGVGLNAVVLWDAVWSRYLPQPCHSLNFTGLV